MDDAPMPSILAAIEQGRGQRGRQDPGAWIRHRALSLTLAQAGLTLGRIGGRLGVGSQHVVLLLAEGCEAVLRGGGESVEADAVCAGRWRRWCQLGDVAACERLRRGSTEPAQRVQ